MLLLVISVLLAGCAAEKKSKTVGAFSLEASVDFNGFVYDCSVVYGADSVTVTAQSTSAAGLVITYDGKSVSLSYEDISFAQNNVNFDPSNPAVALFEALEYANTAESVQPQTVKDGFLINGETSLGEFSLELDSASVPKKLEFADSGLTVTFAGV